MGRCWGEKRMAANRVEVTQIRPMTVHTFLDGDAVWPVSSSQEYNCIRMAGSIGDVKSLTLTLSLCYIGKFWQTNGVLPVVNTPQ